MTRFPPEISRMFMKGSFKILWNTITCKSAYKSLKYPLLVVDDGTNMKKNQCFRPIQHKDLLLSYDFNFRLLLYFTETSPNGEPVKQHKVFLVEIGKNLFC